MRSMKDRWAEAHRHVDRKWPQPVDSRELVRAEDMLRKIKDGLRFNLDNQHVLGRRDGDKWRHLVIDFSADSPERVFGQNIATDLERVIKDGREQRRIPQILDAYSKFGEVFH